MIKILKLMLTYIICASILLYSFNFLKKILYKKVKDKTVLNFLLSIFKYLLIIISLIFFLDLLNIKISPILTILWTIGITIGLSLKNSLSNLSSGILIIILNLFKIDDYIEIEKIIGKVFEIQLFTTTLKTNDGKTIIIPNNKFIVNNIINFSKENKKIIYIEIPIKNENLIRSKKIIENLLKKKINNENEKFLSIDIQNINLVSTNIIIRICASYNNAEKVKTNILEKIIKKLFKKKFENNK